MKNYIKVLILILALSCNTDKEISNLLNSNEPQKIILGAYKAGESGDRKFVPQLFEDLDNPGMTTDIRFKGITIYQAKMIALKKIFKSEPPMKISSELDSTVINYYKKLLNVEK